VTKYRRAFHALVAATGKERSPSVARCVTGTISIDDEDDLRRRRDVTGRPSLAVDCQQGIGRPIAVQTLVHECTELELYSLRHSHSQPM